MSKHATKPRSKAKTHYFTETREDEHGMPVETIFAERVGGGRRPYPCEIQRVGTAKDLKMARRIASCLNALEPWEMPHAFKIASAALAHAVGELLETELMTASMPLDRQREHKLRALDNLRATLVEWQDVPLRERIAD